MIEQDRCDTIASPYPQAIPENGNRSSHCLSKFRVSVDAMLGVVVIVIAQKGLPR